MTSTFSFVVELLVLLISMILFSLACQKTNMIREYRYKQFPMPVIGVLYSFIVMILIGPVTKAIIGIIRDLADFFYGLSGAEWLPMFLSNKAFEIGTSLDGVTDPSNVILQFVITNIFIMVFYIMIKSFVMVAINKHFTDNSGGNLDRIYEGFYEYSYDEQKWFLEEDNIQARNILGILYLFALVISCLLMIASCILYAEEIFMVLFYPVFCIILIGEPYFYMDGLTEEEHNVETYGESATGSSVNYSIMRTILKNLFGDKLLADNTRRNESEDDETTVKQIVEEMHSSEDPKINSLAEYIDIAAKNDIEFEPNYLRSMRELVEGNSILFNNPFYQDLIPYAFYQMNRTLLSHKKVLVVLGRHACEEDIQEWIEEGIGSVTNIPFLWKIGLLDEDSQDIDIGIITRSNVHNIALHENNAEFLEDVEYVVVLEPSKLIATAQIGLNLLVKKMRGDNDKKIVYCLIDKNCDGIVDAMSHILMTNITEVSAMKKHKGTSSYMCWEADEEYLHHRITPSISRYLGLGTELSFAALRNRIPKSTWYGGETFPVNDISWIAKQYYHELMSYAGLPSNQDEMSKRFITRSNLWSAKVDEDNYITVEDESFNMFEILRAFATRADEQGFINVVSSDYLLKEYMADNSDIFTIDAKAIPCIVADYARTNRNVTLRLLLMMSTLPVNEYTVRNEMSLLGIEVYNLRNQFWYEVFKCFADLSTISSLPADYNAAVNEAAQMEIVVDGESFSSNVITLREEWNYKTNVKEMVFSISDCDFINACVKHLQSAAYVAEDERGERYYLGTELCDHVYSKYLPGQFFTFGGKYYEMQYMTADNQVLVRRAADHISGRPTYRQIRAYRILDMIEADVVGSKKNYDGIVVSRAFADIDVDTLGYYRMERYNDFEKARKVLFEGEKSRIPQKQYRNKEMLIIDLPDKAGELTDEIRYTITVLINEVFRTLFAENQSYISAVTCCDFMGDDYDTIPLTYSLSCDCGDEVDKRIYIIEDSRLDMGLISAVERNLQRIFFIVTDYLEWHFDKLEDEKNPPKAETQTVTFVEKTEEPEEKYGVISRIVGRIKERIPSRNGRSNMLLNESAEEPVVNELVYEKEETVKSKRQIARKPYSQRYFLLFGASEANRNLDLVGASKYLTDNGFGENPLKQAREGKETADLVAASYNPDKPGARFCDFCGCEVFAGNYETLFDGRDRCKTCSRTVIKSIEELRSLFEEVKRNMEAFFGIRLNMSVRVEMVNAKKLQKKLGRTFVPTAGFDGRVLGVAINQKGGFKILMENGAPRLGSMQTMVHELTHIWQYSNWNEKLIKSNYGELELQIYEGMAKWAEIQYCYLVDESAAGMREEIITNAREDEYGNGLLRFRSQYPIIRETSRDGLTPFDNISEPLKPDFCGEIVKEPGEQI